MVAAVDDQLSDERQGVARAEGYVDDLDARIDDAVDRLRDLDARVSAFETSIRTASPRPSASTTSSSSGGATRS